MKKQNQSVEKVNLNTNILMDTDRELERLKSYLRSKKAKRRVTSKGSLIDILVNSPEAKQILERVLL